MWACGDGSEPHCRCAACQARVPVRGSAAACGTAGRRRIAPRRPRMDSPARRSVFPGQLAWENEGTSRIPFMAYTSEALHRRELERFFYRKHWCYVGLEAEIPNPGDFKRTVVGERSVIMVRDADGAHQRRRERLRPSRHAASAASATATGKDFTCPYHQWNYTLKGDLQGVPFRRGVKQDGKVNGGMPADFKPADHGLTKLKVATRGGVVFASFDPRRRVARGLPRPDDPALLRSPVRRPQAEDPRLQPPAHSGQLEADAGEHQGPVPPGPAAHLVRHLRPLARRQQVAADDGRAPSPRRDDLDARRRAARPTQVTQVSSFKDEHEAQRPALPRHRARALVGRPDGGDDDAVPERDLPAAGQLASRRGTSSPSGHGAFDFVWTHFGFEDDTPR